MSIEKVKYSIKVYDNIIEIIPEGGVKDNSLYEIKLQGLKSTTSDEQVADSEVKFVTAMSPMFCSIMDVASLMDIVEVPEDIVLYNIREASKYAEYVFNSVHKGRKKLNVDSVPFAIKEFARYKAAKDCLMKIYMSLISDKMVEGMLGEVRFKVRDQIPDIRRILDYLDKEIQKWLDAIKGYDLEGRAKMKTAVKGYHHGGYNKRTTAERRITPKPVGVSIDRGVY